MNLESRYNEFYKSSLSVERFSELSPTGWPKNRSEAIALAAPNGGSVLDIGCGNGNLLFHLRHKFRCLYGLEYSSQRLEQAKINLRDFNFIPLHGSAESMESIESNSIDCVVSADTIEHIPDVYLAAAEMFRVCRPGGCLLINTPNIAFIKKRLLLLLGRFPSTSQPNEGHGSDILFDGGHFHYFTYRSLKILLEKAGFSVRSSIGFGKLGRVHNVYPELLSGNIQIECIKPRL